MQIKSGRDRIVFIFHSIRIVIKFPKIHIIFWVRSFLKECARSFFKKTERENFISFLRNYIDRERHYTIVAYGSFKRLIFKGIVDNWREFQFYRKMQHPFLQPTYFSFFGLINIQSLGDPCMIQYVDLWCQLYELTQGAVFKDSHHFTDPDNFCIQNGNLRILDYGGERVQEVVSEFGHIIMRNFDFAYSWEERKKAT